MKLDFLYVQLRKELSISFYQIFSLLVESWPCWLAVWRPRP
jgi:hypothetical protein